MKNLCKYIAYPLLTVSAIGMFSISYSVDRIQKKVTKLGYISTKLDDVNKIMKGVSARADELNQNAQGHLIDVRRFNEELRLRQIIREELELRGLRKKLE